MKKSRKVWLIIALLMMVVGVGFASVGTAMGGRWGMIFDWDNFRIVSTSKEIVSDKVSIDGSFKKLDIKTSTVDVNIKVGNENTLEYKVPEAYKPEITTVGNTLSVVTRERNGFTLFNFDFGRDEESYINITLTEDMFKEFMNLEFSTSTGDLYIDSVDITGHIETSTGDVRLTGLKSNGISIDGSTSDVYISDCNINGSLKTSLSTGEVIIKNLVITEKYEAETSTGDIEISHSEIPWFIMDGSTSDLKVKSSEMNKVEVNTNTGDVELELNGNEKDYEIKLHTSTGDMNVCGREMDGKSYESPSAEKKINVQTSTGDIDIYLN